MADTLLPTEALAEAHAVIDQLIETQRGRNADSVWISMMNLVGGLEPDQQCQNLALLLTVAVQRMTQNGPPK